MASIFTSTDEMIIRAFYPLTHTQQMIDKLLGGRYTARQINSKARDMRVKKHDFYRFRRLAGFAKGNEPWNKGRYIKNDPVAIRERSRLLINGKPLSHAVWEEHHGKIPAGHVIWFIDHDVTHCDISNLELISKAELMRRNSLFRYPPELVHVMRLKGSLTKKIKHHVRKQHI